MSILLKRFQPLLLVAVTTLVFVGIVSAQNVQIEPIHRRREDVLRMVAEGKTNARAISRVTSPQEAWEQIQLRPIEELKLMMKELISDGILADVDDDDLSDDSTDEDSIRSLAYDEDVIELWFKKHPEDITKYKPKPKPKKTPPQIKDSTSSSSSSRTTNKTASKKKDSKKSSLFSVILDQLYHIGNLMQNLLSKGDSDNDSEL